VILPDVNVLAYAYRREAERHERYAEWLTDVVGGAEELALAEAALTGFVRIVTHPRIMVDPAPTPDALRFVASLRAATRARRLAATDATWALMSTWSAGDPQLRANLVPDAWLAALACSHGARLATADRGFARYPGLDWFDPGR